MSTYNFRNISDDGSPDTFATGTLLYGNNTDLSLLNPANNGDYLWLAGGIPAWTTPSSSIISSGIQDMGTNASVTVNNTTVTATTPILLTCIGGSEVCYVTNVTPSTSFVINRDTVTAGRSVCYVIFSN